VTADPGPRPLDEVLADAGPLIIGALHPEYADVVTETHMADIGNIL
jgi:hypothetical protein